MADIANAVKPAGPDTPSLDYQAMKPYWDMVAALVDGADAVRKVKSFLPKFPNESDDDYAYRLSISKFTNIYGDILDNLSARPFGEQVRLAEEDKVSPAIKEFVNDVDGNRGSLHVFAGDAFYHGINNAIDWIFVDFPSVGRVLSRAEETALRIRPYWLHIRATNMLDVSTDMIGGELIYTGCRILEPVKVKEGYSEKIVNRVRVIKREALGRDALGNATSYGPPTYEIFEEQINPTSKAVEWVSVATGSYSIGEIPIVPFITGKRKGSSWQFVPPLKSAAFLQVEHYQQDTGLKSIKELACYPILTGNGVDLRDDKGNPQPVKVGPSVVLTAPPKGDNGTHGEWTFIEPSGASLTFLANDIKETARELRELGRQPLTSAIGNLTVVTTAFAAQKANSVIQAWALTLKNALEAALKLTAKWLKDPSDPKVRINTDFALDLAEDQTPATLTEMRKNNDLSQETLWAEMKRRGILSPEFDADDEVERLAEEVPGASEAELLASMTPPVNQPGDKMNTTPPNDMQSGDMPGDGSPLDGEPE